VPQVARSEVDKRTSPELAGVKSALYDTLLLSFSRVYVDRDDSAAAQQVDEELHAAAYAMCKLAVIVMADFIA